MIITLDLMHEINCIEFYIIKLIKFYYVRENSLWVYVCVYIYLCKQIIDILSLDLKNKLMTSPLCILH